MLSLNPLERLANFVLQAVIDRHPEIFDRLGPYAQSRFLIDITDSPFSLLLLPQEKYIHVQRRTPRAVADVKIRGNLMTLAQLAQGSGDGDALFFNREIAVEGNTEALLALRNALDNVDIDIIGDSLDSLGFLGSPFRLGYRAIKEIRPIIAGMFAP